MLEAVSQADKIDIEQQRIESQTQIAGMQVGAKMATSQAQLSADQQEAGLRMGVQVAQTQLDHQHRVGEAQRDTLMQMMQMQNQNEQQAQQQQAEPDNAQEGQSEE